jgi:hypothetical protein
VLRQDIFDRTGDDGEKRRKQYERRAYVYSCNFSVHELIFCRGSLKPVLGELHRIFCVVDVHENLKGYHGLDVLSHIIESRKVIYDLISCRVFFTVRTLFHPTNGAVCLHSEPNLLARTWFVLLFGEIIDDGGT